MRSFFALHIHCFSLPRCRRAALSVFWGEVSSPWLVFIFPRSHPPSSPMCPLSLITLPASTLTSPPPLSLSLFALTSLTPTFFLIRLEHSQLSCQPPLHSLSQLHGATRVAWCYCPCPSVGAHWRACYCLDANPPVQGPIPTCRAHTSAPEKPPSGNLFSLRGIW